MQEPRKVRVLSFGAGVQSSALLLMCDRREIEPVDFAIFADPGAEPAEVYAWLKHVKKHVKTPVHVAHRGSIVTEVAGHWAGRVRRCGQPPFFALDKAGKKGMLRRHCTKEYKIELVDREIRRVLGYQPRQKMRHQVELLMGISSDEMGRMRLSTQKWKTNSYPLVDQNLDRAACIAYVEALGIGTPPRSACYFCPYKSNAEWRHLKNNSPEDWDRAVKFDRLIRTSVSPNLTSEFFVHRSRTPLEHADLGETDAGEYSMQDECEGMCGT